MISWNVRSANRNADRGMLEQTVACFVMVASLACLAQPASAQAQAAEPYYSDGEIHCPDGSSAIYHSAGEPPDALALRVACEFKGTTGQATKIPATQSPANTDQAAEKNTIVQQLNALSSAPRSPTGLPMEAVWERASGAPDAEFTDARPYFVSRWGGIVIRGRRNGDHIDKALSARHCGASDNPATDIYFIGEAPANICEGVTQIEVGTTKSITSPITIKGQESSYDKLGTPSGWVVLEFAQNLDGIAHSGLEPATGADAQSWGISSLGAFYRNEDGKHVFYAPGETVQLTKLFSFVVEPVMDPDEIAAKATVVIMNEMAKNPAIANLGRPMPGSTSQWPRLVDLGVPLFLLGGAIYGALRFLRSRRVGQPPVPANSVPANVSHWATAAAASEAVPMPPEAAEAAKGAEEFFGMSRTSANFRRQGWLTLLGFAGPGLFLFSILFWGEPTVVTNLPELLYHFVVAKLLPLGLIGLGIVGAVANFRLGSRPETEVLWYRLDDAGLHILHDALKRVTPSEMALEHDGAGALMTWDSMKSVLVVPGAQPKVKIVRRSPGAVIDRTATLFAGQKSRGGALFEDRLSLWLAAKSAAIQPTVVSAGNPV